MAQTDFSTYDYDLKNCSDSDGDQFFKDLHKSRMDERTRISGEKSAEMRMRGQQDQHRRRECGGPRPPTKKPSTASWFPEHLQKDAIQKVRRDHEDWKRQRGIV